MSSQTKNGLSTVLVYTERNEAVPLQKTLFDFHSIFTKIYYIGPIILLNDCPPSSPKIAWRTVLPMDKVVHFEIPADNIDRAKKFYKETFGWEAQDYPDMKYVILKTVETDTKNMPKEVGAINGGMFNRKDMEGVIEHVSFAIDVEDIDEAVKQIKNAGGLIIKEKMAVGDMGYIAYFKDTEGNILSVWQTASKKQ